MTSTLKRIFINQIQSITWKNKISSNTVNVAVGESVKEIEVISLKLNQDSLDKKVLQLIDKEIPYHILFLLEFENETQAWISFKEESQTKAGTFKSGIYYHTDWLSPDELDLHIEGLNMDSVYSNFIYQIAGDRLKGDKAGTLKDAVIRDEKRQKILKELAALEKKIHNEKQFNKQTELFNLFKLKKKELEEI